MSPFSAGKNEALNILRALSFTEQEKILENIAKKDPSLAEDLRKKIVSFEDLKLMTPKMVQDFLRAINLEKLSRALRMGSSELQNFFLNQISRSMKEEMNSILKGPPLKSSEVQKDISDIMIQVRSMMAQGKIVLREEKDDPLV